MKIKTPHAQFSWRGLAVGLCILLAAISLVLMNAIWWAGNTIVNTNKYVATVGPLIKQPAIQTAIAQRTSDQLFKSVDVQVYVQSALPPKAAFLAPPLTNELETYTQKRLEKLLGRPKIQQYWYSSLTKSHQALIKYSQAYQGDGKIKVSDIYSLLSQRLADTKLAFLSNAKLPPKAGSIEVASAGWLPVLHKVANRIQTYKLASAALTVVLMGLALGLSTKRRQTLIKLALSCAGAMALTLLAVKLAGNWFAADVSSAYQAASQAAYATILHSFNVKTVVILVISLALALVVWLTGPYATAQKLRSKLKP